MPYPCVLFSVNGKGRGEVGGMGRVHCYLLVQVALIMMSSFVDLYVPSSDFYVVTP